MILAEKAGPNLTIKVAIPSDERASQEEGDAQPIYEVATTSDVPFATETTSVISVAHQDVPHLVNALLATWAAADYLQPLWYPSKYAEDPSGFPPAHFGSSRSLGADTSRIKSGQSHPALRYAVVFAAAALTMALVDWLI